MVQARSFRIIQWVIVVAIFVFLGKMVWDNWNQVKDASFTLQPLPFILSTLIFAFSYFIQILAWYFLTLKLGIAISFGRTLESWLYSQLGKYVPGKVWLLLGRFYFYQSKGKSKKAISIALYFETITAIMAAGIISSVALIFSREGGPFHSGTPFRWVILLLILVLTLIRLSLVLVSDLNSRWSLQKIRDGEIRFFKQISAIHSESSISVFLPGICLI